MLIDNQIEKHGIHNTSVTMDFSGLNKSTAIFLIPTKALVWSSAAMKSFTLI